MRRLPLLLILCPVVWADTITPTVTTTIMHTGTGQASASASAVLSGTGVTSEVEISLRTSNAGDSASAFVDLQAEYVAEGTGSALLTYSGQGNADGSAASAELNYQLADVAGSCGFSFCTGGIEVGGGSESIELGTPFFFSLGANGSAGDYNGFGGDAGGSITLNFDVTQNGIPVQLTEVPLPTPEPGSLGMTWLACGLALLARRVRTCRPPR